MSEWFDCVRVRQKKDMVFDRDSCVRGSTGAPCGAAVSFCVLRDGPSSALGVLMDPNKHAAHSHADTHLDGCALGF